MTSCQVSLRKQREGLLAKAKRIVGTAQARWMEPMKAGLSAWSPFQLTRAEIENFTKP